MNASQNRVKFMTKAGMSDVDISLLTGIPRSTIGFVRRGERLLPSEYIRPMYDGFRKVNYNVLREAGLPYHQARKYSSSSVKTSSDVAVEMRMIVEQSTAGAVIGKTVALEKKGILPDPFQVEQDMTAAVLKGYRKSHKDFKQMQDYMLRKAVDETTLHDQQEQALIDMGW